MKSVTIVLRDEDEAYFAASVASGRYESESAIVAEAIAELRIRDVSDDDGMEDLRQKLQVGIDQLDRGEGSEWNLQEMLTKAHARYGK